MRSEGRVFGDLGGRRLSPHDENVRPHMDSWWRLRGSGGVARAAIVTQRLFQSTARADPVSIQTMPNLGKDLTVQPMGTIGWCMYTCLAPTSASQNHRLWLRIRQLLHPLSSPLQTPSSCWAGKATIRVKLRIRAATAPRGLVLMPKAPVVRHLTLRRLL